MEKDMDKKLYDDYLNGNDEAFETLYLKYKDKIRYYIYNLLNEKYRNAIYLNKIENFSYEETAKLLNTSITNVKNLIHRGKKELQKILIKKGLREMNKVSKIIILILCISFILTGGVYATTKIIKKITGKAEMTPTYTSKISSIDTNKVWIGTFNLVWNDFMNDVIGGKIEFEDGPSLLADELNKQIFTIKQLNENSYYKIHGQSTFELKNTIENGIRLKFNEESKVLDKVEWGNIVSIICFVRNRKKYEYV